MTDENKDMELANLLHEAQEALRYWCHSEGRGGKRFSVTKTPGLRDALALINKYPRDPRTDKPWEPLFLSGADLEGMHFSYAQLKYADFTEANLRRATLEMKGALERPYSFIDADLSHATVTGNFFYLTKPGRLTKANLHDALLDVYGIGLGQVFEVRNLATARLPDTRASLPVVVPSANPDNNASALVRVSSLVLAPGRDGLLRFALDTRPLSFNGASTGEKTISLKDAMKAFFSPEILDETPGTPQGCVDLLNRTPNLSGQTLEPSRIEIISDWRARPEPSPAHP